MRIVRRADCAEIPWKNGRGVTRVVAVSPAGAAYEALDWQVSRPTIDRDTAFSRLSGLDRQLMLVSGKGLLLGLRSAIDHVDFEHRIDRPLEPFAFRGDWDVDSKLIDGRVEVLNVMTRRSRAAASVEVREFSAPEAVRKRANETLVVFSSAGDLTAYGTWGTATLHADDSILVDEREAAEIALAAAGSAPASALLIHLELL